LIQLEEGIITPRRFKEDPSLCEVGMMVIFPPMLELLLKEDTFFTHEPKDALFWRLHLKELTGGLPFGLMGPFLGAPQAVMGLEKLTVLGVKEVFVMGCCGAISDELSIGDIFLPHCALSDEGTSKAYSQGEMVFLPGDRALKKLEEILSSKGVGYKKGPILSTDAALRETKKKLEALRRLGIKCVDMEISALFSVGEFRGIEVAGAFVVSDELYHQRWKPGFSSQIFKESQKVLSKKVYEGVMEYVRS